MSSGKKRMAPEYRRLRIGRMMRLLWVCGLLSAAIDAQAPRAAGVAASAVAETDAGAAVEATTALAALDAAQQFAADGNLYEALRLYQQALQVFEQRGQRADRAAVMSAMAVVYRRLGEMERALALQQQAIAAYDDLGDAAGKASGLRRLGVLYRHLGEFEAAIAAQEDALAALEGRDDADGRAMILTNLGTIYGDLGRLSEARTYFERALAIYQRLEQPQGMSYLYGNLGQLHLYLGHPAQAREYLNQSLALKQMLGDRGGQANTLLNLGTVSRNAGDFQQALARYYQALDAYRDLRDDSGAAVALGHLGSVYAELGDLERAMPFQVESLQLKRAHGTPLQIAVTLADLAAVFIEQQQFEEAAQYLEQGLRMAVEQNMTLVQAHIYGQRGNLLLQQGRADQALTALTHALDLYAEAGSQNGLLEIYHALGQALSAHPSPEPAVNAYTQALRLAETLDDRHALWRIRYQLGLIALRQGDADAALRHLIASVETLEQIRSYFDVSELRQMFVRSNPNPYRDIIRILLARHEVKEALVYVERLKARTFLETVASARPEFGLGPEIVQDEHYLAARIHYLQARLRALADTKNRAEHHETTLEEQTLLAKRLVHELTEAKARYEDVLLQMKVQHPEYYRLTVVDADEIRRLVDRALALIEPDVLVIEYFLDDDALHLWAIEHDRLSHVAVPVTRDEVIDMVAQLRLEANAYFSDRAYPLLHTLYGWCLAPLEERLRDKAILGIVPFEALHFVPFGALTSAVWTPDDSAADQVPPYVIEQHALFSLPSLSVLPMVRERSARHEITAAHAETPPTIFGMGNATRNLPGAEHEVAHIVAQFEGSIAYVGETATKQRLFAEAGDYDVVHLATHGVYDKQHPLFSYLELASEALYAREVFGLALRARLVTLSGCETFLPQQVDAAALDALVSGDELVGFVRAFLFAGTPSVVSSLWRVNDEATSRLMTVFYEHLPTAGKATALQRAAQAVIRSTLTVGRRTPRQLSLQHPFFWSSFVLIGDWR
jgi:CHAT domain-containing protein/predicted negative regulator of RcsB-dependent stress response